VPGGTCCGTGTVVPGGNGAPGTGVEGINCGVVGTGAAGVGTALTAGLGTAFTAGPGVAVVRNGSTCWRVLPSDPCCKSTPPVPPTPIVFGGKVPNPCGIAPGTRGVPGKTGMFITVGSNCPRRGAAAVGDVTTPRSAGFGDVPSLKLLRCEESLRLTVFRATTG